jgi:CBS-domain-containing membrane protein
LSYPHPTVKQQAATHNEGYNTNQSLGLTSKMKDKLIAKKKELIEFYFNKLTTLI